jgi:hypothetical protein
MNQKNIIPRTITLSEMDHIGPSEFVAKIQVWLKMFSSEARV